MRFFIVVKGNKSDAIAAAAKFNITLGEDAGYINDPWNETHWYIDAEQQSIINWYNDDGYEPATFSSSLPLGSLLYYTIKE